MQLDRGHEQEQQNKVPLDLAVEQLIALLVPVVKQLQTGFPDWFHTC